MFRYQETPDGVVEYYITKSGKLIRLQPGHPPPNAFDLPSIRPLMAEKEVKEVLYQLFDRHATKTVGVMHGKDVNYLNLRKSRCVPTAGGMIMPSPRTGVDAVGWWVVCRESVRALSRVSGQSPDVLPHSANYEEGEGGRLFALRSAVVSPTEC